MLSKKYDITPQSLKHICKDYNIPVPSADYWASLKAGKKIEIPVLLESNKRNKKIELFLWEESNESDIDIQDSIEKIKMEIEGQKKLPSFSEDFNNPDKLVSAAQKTFKEKTKKDWRNRGLISTNRDELDIKVSPENVERALRFMDTLIKLLRMKGDDIIVSDSSTYAVINGEQLKILFREKLQMEERNDSWGGHDYTPTGKLSLKVDEFSQMEWVDGLGKLEDQLPKILYKLNLKGKREKERSLYHQKQREKRDEINRKAAAIQKTKEEELDNFPRLLSQARRFSQAQLIRDYIAAVDKSASAEIREARNLDAWIAWAKKKADWFDPLINMEDNLLEEVDADAILKHHASKNLTDFSWGDFSGNTYNYFKNKNRYR